MKELKGLVKSQHWVTKALRNALGFNSISNLFHNMGPAIKKAEVTMDVKSIYSKIPLMEVGDFISSLGMKPSQPFHTIEHNINWACKATGEIFSR